MSDDTERSAASAGSQPVAYDLVHAEPGLVITRKRRMDEYRRSMRLPLTFDVYARTDNYEEYEMVIVASSNEQAMVAADALCKKLGLILMACDIRD